MTGGTQNSGAAHQPRVSAARTRFFQEVSSGETKRFRTRGLILDTAVSLIAEKGIDRASIAEITERAGLSNGSFYYHFRDKAELIDAVGAAIAMALVQDVDAVIADVDNGAERVAIASLIVIRTATMAPTWGGLIVHAFAELGDLREQISRGIQKDVYIGIDQGIFDVEPSPAFFAMLLAVVAAAIRELLVDAKANAGADLVAVRLILRALGLPPAEADQFAAIANEAVLRHQLQFKPGVQKAR